MVPSLREQSQTVGWQHCCLVLGLKMVLSLDWPQVLASKSTFRVQGGRSVVMNVWQEETSPGKHSGQGRGAVVGIRWTWTEEAVGANQVWGVRPFAEAVLRGHSGRRVYLRSCPVEGGMVETGGTPAMATLLPPQPPSGHPVLSSTCRFRAELQRVHARDGSRD